MWRSLSAPPIFFFLLAELANNVLCTERSAEQISHELDEQIMNRRLLSSSSAAPPGSTVGVGNTGSATHEAHRTAMKSSMTGDDTDYAFSKNYTDKQDLVKSEHTKLMKNANDLYVKGTMLSKNLDTYQYLLQYTAKQYISMMEKVKASLESERKALIENEKLRQDPMTQVTEDMNNMINEDHLSRSYEIYMDPGLLTDSLNCNDAEAGLLSAEQEAAVEAVKAARNSGTDPTEEQLVAAKAAEMTRKTPCQNKAKTIKHLDDALKEYGTEERTATGI